jgi:hypothetical protein
MDTPEQQRLITAGIAEIKAHMPDVYQAIQDHAALIGKPAFTLVRRGLKGEKNCFYAFERGRVVGTVFAGPHEGLMKELATNLVQFGVKHVAMWGVINGAD